MNARTHDLDHQLDRLEHLLPDWMSRFIQWVRQPHLWWARILAGVGLCLCGVVGFLPILGFWMIPLGLALLALDIPFMRGPIARLIAWGEAKWRTFRGPRK
jgi:hypothetical protein